MKACFIYRYNFITQVLRFKFFLNSSLNFLTFRGSFLICCGRGVILEKSSLCNTLSTCLVEYFLLVSPSIISENCFTSIEQKSLLAALAFFLNSILSFARVFLVNGVGLPLRGKFLMLPVLLCLAINLLTAD